MSCCFVFVVHAADPVLFYSDLDSGPVVGGENNHGVYVCISGSNFGAIQADSTITVGGVSVATYAYWGSSGVNGAATDKACFQMSPQTPQGPTSIILTARGASSNPLPFVVRSEGKIYCVDSQNGNDRNDGRYTTDAPAGSGCKASLSVAYGLLKPGDTLYVQTGGYLTNPKSGAVLFLSGSGSPGLPKAISGYPGADVTLGSDQPSTGGPTYAVRALGDGYPCDYHTIANINGVHGKDSGIELDGCENVRVVGNSVSCPYQISWQGCVGAGSVYNGRTGNVKQAANQKWYGNDIHNVGTSVSAQYAGGTLSGPFTVKTGVNDKILISVDGGPDQDITLAACDGCSAATIAADLTSKLKGATATVIGGGGSVLLQTISGGYDFSTLAIKATANNAYALFGWLPVTRHGGSGKYTHSVYFGTNAHDLDFGWNVVRDSNACRGIQFHSSPLGGGVLTDPTGQSLYGLDVHDNLVYNVPCDGITFASVDPSLGPVKAYNNVIWNAGTGKNATNEGGNSGINIGQLHNKFYASSIPDCVWASSGTQVTGSASCRFTSELQVGWALTSERAPDVAAFGASRDMPFTNINQHLQYSATIISIQDDQHLTLELMPPPYNRVWLVWGSDYRTANFSNQKLMWIKSGRGNIDIYNNTLYANGNAQTAYIAYAGAYCRSGGAKLMVGRLVNNIIYQTGNVPYQCPSQIPTGDANGYSVGDHNLFFSSGNAGAVPPFSSNNVLADPQFLAAPSDFHLAPGSPAHGAGTNAQAAPRDFNGLTRPQNGTVDIGAYQLLGSGGTTSGSACDLNGDGVVNKKDVQAAINQIIGAAPCGNAAALGGSSCNITSVQRVANAAVGAGCILPQ